MAIWERIWRANCAVAVFDGRAGTHGACKPGAEWERRSGRRLHKSARRASFPAASKPDRGQHLVTGSAEACAQAVQLLSGTPPCPYYGASDRTRCAPRAIARRWQAGRRRRGRGMDLQTAQSSLCAPPFPYCGAQGAMQAAPFPTASKPDRGQHLVSGSAAACAQAVQLLSGAPPCPYLWHYGVAGRMQRRNRTSTRSIAQATVRRMHGRLCPGRRIPG